MKIIYTIEVHRTRTGSTRYVKAFTIATNGQPMNVSRDLASRLDYDFCSVRNAVALPQSFSASQIEAATGYQVVTI